MTLSMLILMGWMEFAFPKKRRSRKLPTLPPEREELRRVLRERTARLVEKRAAHPDGPEVDGEIERLEWELPPEVSAALQLADRVGLGASLKQSTKSKVMIALVLLGLLSFAVFWLISPTRSNESWSWWAALQCGLLWAGAKLHERRLHDSIRPGDFATDYQIASAMDDPLAYLEGLRRLAEVWRECFPDRRKSYDPARRYEERARRLAERLGTE